MDTRRRKTNSFPILGTRPESPSHELILVHGFKKLYEYATTLEAWVETVVASLNVKPGSLIRIIPRVFEFEINDVDDLGAAALEAVTTKLRSKIDHLRRDKRSVLFSRSKHSISSSVFPESNNLPRISNGTHPIIFIAHGLGAYVVKRLLSCPYNGVNLFCPAGVVFVDAKEVTISQDYPKYLAALALKFSLKVSAAQHETGPEHSNLCQRLHEIDADFQKFRHMSPAFKSQSIDIWISENPILEAITVSEDAHYSFFLRMSELMEQPGKGFGHIKRLAKLAVGKRINPDKVVPKQLNRLCLEQILASHGLPPDKSSKEVAKEADPTSLNEQRNTDIDNHSLALRVSSNDTSPITTQDGRMDQWTVDSSRRLKDISRAASMKTVIEIADKSDTLSVFSMPIFVSISENISADVRKTTDLALAFFSNGEFINATLLFEKSLDSLIAMNPPPDPLQLIEVRLQLAVISLYRGKYRHITDTLQSLMDELSNLQAGQYTKECTKLAEDVERWVATSLLFRGHYHGAAAKLESLLQKASERSQASKVRVLRDLAMTNGLLGQYREAQAFIDQAAKSLRESLHPELLDEKDIVELRAKGHSIIFTHATLDMLWGEYASALEKAQRAFRGFRDRLGNKHLRTLESLSLVVRLLAYMSQYTEAEMLCKPLIQLMSQEIGRMHPLTLATTEIHVSIMRSQSRLTEALDTVKSLYRMTDDVLTSEHPQTLSARRQLGLTYLALGSYHSAEYEFRETVSSARHLLGICHPDTLSYQSEWASVLCSYGDLEEAMSIAMDALRKQTALYALYPPGTPQSLLNIPEHEFLRCVVEEMHTDTPAFKRHPSIISTLQIIAQIEAKDLGMPLDHSEKVLQAVIERSRIKLGHFHAFTLASEYEFALVVRENDVDGSQLEYVNGALYHVWQERCRIFGHSHPETLVAERELVITACLSGDWTEGGPTKRTRTAKLAFAERRDENIDTKILAPPPLGKREDPETFQTELPHPIPNLSQMRDVEEVTQIIFLLQEPQLGPLHPETLRSLLWLFTAQLLARKTLSDDAKATWHTLLHKVREPTIRKERLIEALRMEERVALIFAYQGYPDLAMGILRDILDVTLESSKNLDLERLQKALYSLKMDVQKEIHTLEPQVDKFHQRLERITEEYQRPRASDDRAEGACSEIYKLRKRLFGRRDPKTVEAKFNLALLRWATGDPTKRRKALKTALQLRNLDGSMLPPHLRQTVKDKCEIWTSELMTPSDVSAVRQTWRDLQDEISLPRESYSSGSSTGFSPGADMHRDICLV